MWFICNLCDGIKKLSDKLCHKCKGSGFLNERHDPIYTATDYVEEKTNE